MKNKIYNIFFSFACVSILFAACSEEKKEDYNPVFDSSKLAIVETGEALGNYGTALKLSMKTTSNNALDTVIQQGIVLAPSQDQLDLLHGVV